MKAWLCIAVIGIAALCPSIALSEELHQSFDVVVPQSPIPVPTEDRVMLVYELHLTNFATKPLSIKRLLISDSDTGKQLASFSESSLANRIHFVSGAYASDASIPDEIILSGEQSILYVEFTVASESIPNHLRHEIEYSSNSDSRVFTVHLTIIAVDRRPPVVLGPPFHDGTWVAIHAASWPRGHRRMIYTLSGKARIPGRFAIDWLGLDDQGRMTHGDPDHPNDAIGYGTPILAGADAVVASVRDGVQESPSIAGNPGHALGFGSGNYVALNLGAGRYAFYEHLKQGSICVHTGQQVHKGEIIGKLGFSGDTTGPHLHLHVADGPDPLEAEGLPFLIGPYVQIGRYDDLEELGKGIWTPSPTEGIRHRRIDWPGSNAVVRFSAK